MSEHPETRPKRPRNFFSPEEQESIVEAIVRAERRTSGEIRVHLEHECGSGDVYGQARQVFERLGMTATAERNGVLLHLVTGDRQFAVLGDQGIDQRVPSGFWEDVVALMEERFREGAFVAGMILGIDRIGEKLAEYFPYAGPERDANELPDDISMNEDTSD